MNQNTFQNRLGAESVSYPVGPGLSNRRPTAQELRESMKSEPAKPTEKKPEPERPEQASGLPPAAFIAAIVARAGAEVFTNAERAELQKIQRRIDRLNREIQSLSWDVVRQRRKTAPFQIAGKTTPLDAVIFAPGANPSGVCCELRKRLKRKRLREIERCGPIYSAIAERVENVARSLFPAIRAEDQASCAAWGREWAPSPLLRDLGRLTILPSRFARDPDEPKRFLARFGLQLKELKGK